MVQEEQMVPDEMVNKEKQQLQKEVHREQLELCIQSSVDIDSQL